jgi:hypothetical protein
MSKSRGCFFYKALDQKWYVALNEDEYDYELGSAVHYGPFNSEEDAEQYVRNGFSNPGGSSSDDSGDMPAPKNSVSPRHR